MRERIIVAATTTERWASCSRWENEAVSKTRHLVKRGGVTTLCRCTASAPEVWVTNAWKPKCPTCETAHAAALVEAAAKPEGPHPEWTKPGSLVKVVRWAGRSRVHVYHSEVVRRTKTLVVLRSGDRFRYVDKMANYVLTPAYLDYQTLMVPLDSILEEGSRHD